jgi:hypothetical protein
MPILSGAAANPNRTVAVLTPLVFAPLAGTIAALAAKYGLSIDGNELQATFIAGSTIAFAKAGLWMKGWQDFEKRQSAESTDPLDVAGEADIELEDGDDEKPLEAFAFEAAEQIDDDVLDAHVDLDDELDEDDLDDMDDFEAEAEALLAGQGS